MTTLDDLDRAMTHKGFVLIYKSGYDDPDVYGPYDTFEDALQEYQRRADEGGVEISDDELVQTYYDDPDILIGRFHQEGEAS